MRSERWKDLLRDISGQDLLEYALLAGLIAVVAVVFLQKFSNTYANVPNLLLNKLGVSF